MDKKEFVLDWIRYAKSDLITARHMFEDVYPKETEIAAWHSQQCAEKTLKAFLVANNIEPPKIHNLEELVKRCQNIDSSFSEIQYDCQRINPYGAVTRYPNEWNVDETIAQTVIARAQKIYDFCVTKIFFLIQDTEWEIK
ncbi:MAG: HEPN domain-containing protein [Planctomycetaceae bacterium]|jgi:HEPN domain-containing protein|nr:HEPN domain-containing protein [Planctomycetaceae bacterium]